MCNFFSFISDGKGQFYYLGNETSHTQIANEKGLNEDKCNKYEYNPFTKTFTVDQINTTDDRHPAEEWVKKLFTKKEFAYLKPVKKRIAEIKKIKWFQPMAKPDKKKLQVKVDAILKAFHLDIKASVEIKLLQSLQDWDAARDAAWDAARDVARDAARDVAWVAAWDAARVAAWDAARVVARDAAWVAARDVAWVAAWDVARDVARDVAWDVARDVAWDAAWDVARDAAWDAARDVAWVAAWDAVRDVARDVALVLVEDLMPQKGWKENPFAKLMELWEAGFYVCGLVNGKFLLYYVPKKMKVIKK